MKNAASYKTKSTTNKSSVKDHKLHFSHMLDSQMNTMIRSACWKTVSVVLQPHIAVHFQRNTVLIMLVQFRTESLERSCSFFVVTEIKAPQTFRGSLGLLNTEKLGMIFLYGWTVLTGLAEE